MDGMEHSAGGRSGAGGWVLGAYAWLLALSFGAAMLDVVYAGAIGRVDGSTPATLFNDVSDFLQLPLALSALAGIAALAIAVQRPLARTLVIGSLVLALAPLPGLVLFGDALAAGGAGAGLRLGLGGAASLLAMAAALVFVGGRRRAA